MNPGITTERIREGSSITYVARDQKNLGAKITIAECPEGKSRGHRFTFSTIISQPEDRALGADRIQCDLYGTDLSTKVGLFLDAAEIVGRDVVEDVSYAKNRVEEAQRMEFSPLIRALRTQVLADYSEN
jgi:hypothetical protein